MLEIRENNACPRQTRHFMTKNTGAPFNCCVDFPKATEVKKFQKLKTNNAELCSKKVGFFMMQDFETMQVHCAVHACLVYSIVPQTFLNTVKHVHSNCVGSKTWLYLYFPLFKLNCTCILPKSLYKEKIFKASYLPEIISSYIIYIDELHASNSTFSQDFN